MELAEIDQFPATIIKVGNALMVTIPKRNIDFSGLKEGDTIKIWFKKHEPTTTEEKEEEAK